MLGLDPQEFRADPWYFEDDGDLIVPRSVTEHIVKRALGSQRPTWVSAPFLAF